MTERAALGPLAWSAAPHLLEHTLATQTLLEGRFLRAVRDTVRLPDGQEATREYCLHPGACVVIALLDDGRVVLERQYRHPLGRVMVEFPAGKIDPGEDLLLCAQRELREETGYSAQQWAYAGAMHPVIAYSTEVIHIWFARGLALGERALDAGEFLDVFTATPAEMLAACQRGELTDAKTLTGLLWLQNVQAGLWELPWQDTEPGHAVGSSPA